MSIYLFQVKDTSYLKVTSTGITLTEKVRNITSLLSGKRSGLANKLKSMLRDLTSDGR
jgi:hypothetical protein